MPINNYIMNTQLTDTDYTDRRRKTSMVIDTETTMHELEPHLIFDIGWTISEPSNKRMVMHRSYIIKEVFLDMVTMSKAFYFEKYPLYVQALASQKAQLVSWAEMLKSMVQDMLDFNVSQVYAYNSKFDSGAIRKTHKFLVGKAFTINLKMRCLWNATCQTFLDNPVYIATAIEQGWLSDKNNVKTSAEMAWRYLSGDYDFIESHTALEDSVIETQILWKLMASSKKKDFNNTHDNWALVARRAHALFPDIVPEPYKR